MVLINEILEANKRQRDLAGAKEVAEDMASHTDMPKVDPGLKEVPHEPIKRNVQLNPTADFRSGESGLPKEVQMRSKKDLGDVLQNNTITTSTPPRLQIKDPALTIKDNSNSPQSIRRTPMMADIERFEQLGLISQ